MKSEACGEFKIEGGSFLPAVPTLSGGFLLAVLAIAAVIAEIASGPSAPDRVGLPALRPLGQSALARSICRDRLHCFGSMVVFVIAQAA